MAINVISVQYNGGFLSDMILLTQCYYYRETRLNAMKRFCFCSLPGMIQAHRVFCLCFAWCLRMAINVSAHNNGGFLPDMILLSNPIECHEEVLSLQPVILPKHFDIFSPCQGMLRKSSCVHIFLLKQ